MPHHWSDSYEHNFRRAYNEFRDKGHDMDTAFDKATRQMNDHDDYPPSHANRQRAGRPNANDTPIHRSVFDQFDDLFDALPSYGAHEHEHEYQRRRRATRPSDRHREDDDDDDEYERYAHSAQWPSRHADCHARPCAACRGGYNVREAAPRRSEFPSSRRGHRDYNVREQVPRVYGYGSSSARTARRHDDGEPLRRESRRREGRDDSRPSYYFDYYDDDDDDDDVDFDFDFRGEHMHRRRRPSRREAGFGSRANNNNHHHGNEYGGGGGASYNTRTAAPGGGFSSGARPGANRGSAYPDGAGGNSNPDLYAILGVSRTASQDEIKRAHRKLSLKHHPDRAKGDDKAKATNRMAEINRAHDVLGDEIKRNVYDRSGEIVL